MAKKAAGGRVTPSRRADDKIGHARRLLLSGSERHFASARELIRANRNDIEFRVLALQDDVKRWIENNDEKVKPIAFLDDVVRRAQKLDHELEPGQWYARAIVARALRYGGRLNRARNLYARAQKEMGGFAKDGGEADRERSYVLADYAEFWAYLGYSAKAEETFALIPAKLQKGWLLWALAFIQHQAAFTDIFPGVGPALPIGEIARYREAIRLLGKARAQNGDKDDLSPKEIADSFLLEAANWGGIYRRLLVDGADEARLKAARKSAEKAVEQFTGQADAAVNGFWSWKKEQRGSMARRYIQGIDAPANAAGEAAAAAWRGVLADHYRLNLAAAGIGAEAQSAKPGLLVPPQFADGDTAKGDDPGDDD